MKGLLVEDAAPFYFGLQSRHWEWRNPALAMPSSGPSAWHHEAEGVLGEVGESRIRPCIWSVPAGGSSSATVLPTRRCRVWDACRR